MNFDYITSHETDKNKYIDRGLLQLEHFVSKLDVKEYEMPELHYQETNENMVLHMSQALFFNSGSHLKQIHYELRSNSYVESFNH